MTQAFKPVLRTRHPLAVASNTAVVANKQGHRQRKVGGVGKRNGKKTAAIDFNERLKVRPEGKLER